MERTRSRPLASGQLSLSAAWAFLIALCLIGLVVLLHGLVNFLGAHVMLLSESSAGPDQNLMLMAVMITAIYNVQ